MCDDSREFNAAPDRVHGVYSTHQYRVRLSMPIHSLFSDEINEKSQTGETLTEQELRAYSTYLHENIHWWQHIGSVSGLIMSLQPSMIQRACNDNVSRLIERGCVNKPIKNMLVDGLMENEDILEQIILNSFDIHDFVEMLFGPDDKGQFDLLNLYSKGFCSYKVYLTLREIFNEVIGSDDSFKKLNECWNREFEKLLSSNHPWYKEHSIPQSPVNIKHLFEGQACFSQMQYLSSVSNEGDDSIDYYREEGVLHGVYEEAFLKFIEWTGTSEPLSIRDNSILLFLLICDLSINPYEGFPCNIINFQNFVIDVDPGLRFKKICAVIKQSKDTGSFIPSSPSKEEYIRVSELICNKCGFISPEKGGQYIKEQCCSQKIVEFLESSKDLEFYNDNVVLKFLISKYLFLNLDRLEMPEFFCWPGYHMAWSGSVYKEQWENNSAVFYDAEYDDDTYIIDGIGKSESHATSFMSLFYSEIIVYDIFQQLIFDSGAFKTDYSWISSRYSSAEWEEFARNLFMRQYNLDLSKVG